MPKIADGAYFDWDHNKIHIELQTHTWYLKVGNFAIKTFKTAFLGIFKPIINKAFPPVANLAIRAIQSSMHGEIHGGIIASLAQMLPANNIKVPHDTYINYAIADDNRARIDDGRLTGYFVGDILGLNDAQKIKDPKFQKIGNLNVDNHFANFEYQISSKVINDMFNVLLRENQIPIDVSYEKMVEINFPIEWTSTQLEGAVPDLCNSIGYDVPLSARFKNLGAPKFVFQPENMQINFGLEVEVWNQNFSQKFLTFKFKKVIIDFDMRLDKKMILYTTWNNLQVDDVHVESKYITNLARSHADKKVLQYFNWSFDLILPWVNASHQRGVSSFEIPKTIPDVVIMNNLVMDVRDNYLNFQMDPKFIFK